MSVKAPAPTAAALRENRLKLLTLLQQASGNWAILLDVQSQAVEQAAAEEPQPPAAAVAEMEPATVEETAPVSLKPVSASVESIPEGTMVEESIEEFIDLTAIEDLPEDAANLSREDLGFSKRSVIHDPEEIAATAKMPPVQKVLDLFGGEIVDIHA